VVLESNRAGNGGAAFETAGDYLRVAEVALRAPGGWGHHSAQKTAIEVTTDSGAGSGAQDSKPAIGVTTGFLKGEAASGPAAKPPVSACELIGLEIERGRCDGYLPFSEVILALIRPDLI